MAAPPIFPVSMLTFSRVTLAVAFFSAVMVTVLFVVPRLLVRAAERICDPDPEGHPPVPDDLLGLSPDLDGELRIFRVLPLPAGLEQIGRGHLKTTKRMPPRP